MTEEEWAGLDPEVRAEPRQALVAGPGRDGAPGLADVEAVLEEALLWLGRPGAVVVELAPAQAEAARDRARQLGYDEVRVEPDLAGRPVRSWHGSAAHNRDMDMDVAAATDDARPPLVGAGAAAVVEALVAGAIVAVPNVGGYSLAVRAGSLDDEARLIELAADPDGPHYAVGQIDDVRALTSGWTDELGTLLQRCWPGPVEVFLPWAGAATQIGRRAGRRIATQTTAPERRLGGRGGHARRAGAAPALPRARPMAHRPPPLHRAGGSGAGLQRRRRGGRRRRRPTRRPAPTVVDATLTPIRVLREGALPTSFIEGTMLMSTRRKLFSRTKRAPAG